MSPGIPMSPVILRKADDGHAAAELAHQARAGLARRHGVGTGDQLIGD